MSSLDTIDRFLARAAAEPNAAALLSRDASVTYAELEARVRRFANVVSIRTQPRVLIALKQGTDAYAAMLATGLAGGYYIPANVTAPAEKLRYIIRLSEPDIVLVDGAELPDPVRTMIGEEASAAAVLDVATVRQAEKLPGNGARHSIAYVIFTSGSTGVPKGVVIPRVGLDHYVNWAIDALALGPGDKVAQHANIGFDLSVLPIYGAFCSGAALCPVVEAGDRLLPARLIARLGITVWISVPSVISLMMRARQVTCDRLASVRLFLFCGEPLLREQVDAIFAACPETTVFNTFGPTEATVSMTALPFKAGDVAEASAASVALGEAIPGMGLHLVGGRDAEEGEIVITGPQLAQGYWNDPERTAQSFREVVVQGQPMRGYFTGDWAERRGKFLFFKERIDHQVKVNGFRIELDEVASAIRMCGWPMVCVFKRGEALSAVVEAQDGVEFDGQRLQAALAAHLDTYAIPTVIRVIASMPRNANDKIDRQAVIEWLEASLGAPDAAARR